MVASGSSPNRPSMSQPRSVGSGEIASCWPVTRSHRSSGLLTPPGYRQLIPMMAMGSWSASSTSFRRLRTVRRSAVARLR